MKRSKINRLINEAIDFMESMNFYLPKWGYWSPEDWKGKEVSEIVENMLGWDLTDFGSGNFERRGLLLFTLRNGSSGIKPYAEKIMVVEKNQETPFHFHWSKIEDIINRGGGRLAVELYNSTDDGKFLKDPVNVKIDSIPRKVEAGRMVLLEPGESICLERKVYHRFYALDRRTLVGEVSSVNNDNTDNRFYEPLGRFPEIEEDEEMKRLLVIDYRKYFNS